MKQDILDKNHERIKALWKLKHIDDTELSETIAMILDVVYEYGYIEGSKDALEKLT